MPARKDGITHTDILADDDGSMIRRVSPWNHLYFAKEGRFLGTFGASGTIDDRTGSGFSAISGLAVIGDRLYVLDSGNLRLLEFEIGGR